MTLGGWLAFGDPANAAECRFTRIAPWRWTAHLQYVLVPVHWEGPPDEGMVTVPLDLPPSAVDAARDLLAACASCAGMRTFVVGNQVDLRSPGTHALDVPLRLPPGTVPLGEVADAVHAALGVAGLPRTKVEGYGPEALTVRVPAGDTAPVREWLRRLEVTGPTEYVGATVDWIVLETEAAHEVQLRVTWPGPLSVARRNGFEHPHPPAEELSAALAAMGAPPVGGAARDEYDLRRSSLEAQLAEVRAREAACPTAP